MIFFYYSAQKTLGWWGGEGWTATIATWQAAGIPTAITLVAMVLEAAVAIALFFGFLTRLAGLGVIALMVGAMIFFYGPVFEDLKFPIVVISIGLALIGTGGGIFSLDRGISRMFLPDPGYLRSFNY